MKTIGIVATVAGSCFAIVYFLYHFKVYSKSKDSKMGKSKSSERLGKQTENLNCNNSTASQEINSILYDSLNIESSSVKNSSEKVSQSFTNVETLKVSEVEDNHVVENNSQPTVLREETSTERETIETVKINSISNCEPIQEACVVSSAECNGHDDALSSEYSLESIVEEEVNNSCQNIVQESIEHNISVNEINSLSQSCKEPEFQLEIETLECENLMAGEVVPCAINNDLDEKSTSPNLIIDEEASNNNVEAETNLSTVSAAPNSSSSENNYICCTNLNESSNLVCLDPPIITIENNSHSNSTVTTVAVSQTTNTDTSPSPSEITIAKTKSNKKKNKKKKRKKSSVPATQNEEESTDVITQPIENEKSNQLNEASEEDQIQENKVLLEGENENTEVDGETIFYNCILPETHKDQFIVYQFCLPQHLVGKLIGMKGAFINKLKAATNTKITLVDNPSKDFKICNIEGKRCEVFEVLEMVKARFPRDLFPEVDLSPLNNVAPESLHLVNKAPYVVEIPPGIVLDVQVSTVASTGEVWLQQPLHPSFQKLQKLHHCMNINYGTGADSPLPSMPFPENLICACHVKNQWFRGMVLEQGEAHCLVTLLDIGGHISLPISSIRQIRTDYAGLPFQAARAFLYGVQPPNESGWTEEGRQAVVDLVKNSMIYATVMAYTPESIPLVNLYNRRQNKYSLINKELIDRGYAKPVSNQLLLSS